MEVRIGINQSTRELSFETDATTDEIRAILEAQTDGLAVFTDTKGRQFLINRASITYVELGSDTVRKVGFIS